jgi:hypothetical protein
MHLAPHSIVLWPGPKHAGKTSGAVHFVEAAEGRGFVVAGW